MDTQPVSMSLPTADGKALNLLYNNGYWSILSDHGAGVETQLRYQIYAYKASNDDLRQKIAKCSQLLTDLKYQHNKLSKSQASFLNM